MPHKRNPVLSENLTGLARLVRGYALPALEDVALWHERDISHSSVERVIGPDATIALDFALVRLTGLIENLVVYPERMRANLDKLGGLIHSQQVLLALIEAGVSREDAYRLVQRNAMKVWEEQQQFPRRAARRQGGEGRAAGKDAARPVRRQLPPEARGHDLRPRVRQGRRKASEAAPRLAASQGPIVGIAVIVAAPAAAIGVIAPALAAIDARGTQRAGALAMMALIIALISGF